MFLDKLFNLITKNKKVTDFLSFKKGTVVNIRHGSEAEFSVGIIQAIKDHCLYLNLPEDFSTTDIEGKNLECRVEEKDFEYLIYGSVSGVRVGEFPLIEVAVSSYHKYPNRRNAKRYSTNYNTSITLKDLNNKISGACLNISLTGVFMAVSTEHDIELKSDVEVEIDVGDGKTLKFSALVVRSVKEESVNKYGMQVRRIDKVNSQILQDIISEIEQNVKSLALYYLIRRRKF
ncbi:MAG: PilZ domain-containing protein [Clostridia bacterium]|nr:PilZ domain-containing protein [Clostridia bacterium]